MANPVIKSGVGQADIEINQGSTFDVTLTYKDSAGNPIDLTGYDARMKIKQKKSDATEIVELSVTNGRIILGGAAGTIRLLIDAALTATLDFPKSFYDLELVNGSVVSRILEGRATLSKEVTT